MPLLYNDSEMLTKLTQFKKSCRNLASWLLAQGLTLPQSKDSFENDRLIATFAHERENSPSFDRWIRFFTRFIQKRRYIPLLGFLVALFILPFFMPSLRWLSSLLTWLLITLIAIIILFLALSMANAWAAENPDKIYGSSQRFKLKNESYERSLTVVTSGKWFEKIVYSDFLRGFLQWINSGKIQWIALLIILLPNYFQNSFSRILTNVFFVVITINIFSTSIIVRYRENHNLPAFSYLPLTRYFGWTTIISDLLFIIWAAAQVANLLHGFFG